MLRTILQICLVSSRSYYHSFDERRCLLYWTLYLALVLECAKSIIQGAQNGRQVGGIL